jgi:type II secretion system protein I
MTPTIILKSNRGFTLNEVMIALSIFAIGILAVASLMISSINENTSARKMTEATTLAEMHLESLMAQDYASIADGTTTEGAYSIAWTVAEDDVVANTKSLTVTVTWTDRGKQRSVSIRNLISKVV